MVEDEDAGMKESVQRLHRYIVDAAAARSGDAFAAPVTVAEIYQEIAPYRTVRTVLGFEMNADYEHVLMRMLAGIDGLAQLDLPAAREKLRRELESPNPDVGLYREYAGCDVVLNPPAVHADWVREQLDEDVQTINGEVEVEHAERPDAQDDSWTAAAYAATHSVFELEMDSAQAADERVAVNGGATCGYCHAALPHNRTLRYCPFCGTDQSMQPCAKCGEPLDPAWAFCIACGTATA
jgi:hypothetical protein